MNRHGFTLIEVMFAIAIVGVGIGSVIIAQNNSLNAMFRAQRMTTVSTLAKNALIEAERELEGKTFDETREELTGTFPAPYADYSWERKIKKITFPNLMENMADGGGSEPGKEGESADSKFGVTTVNENVNRVVKLATSYLSKSTREVSITISWKEKGQEQKFSVSQYWVDLQNEFSMSAE